MNTRYSRQSNGGKESVQTRVVSFFMPFLSVLLVCTIAYAEDHSHESEPITLDNIIVTAERINEYTNNYPGQVVVMGLGEIEQRNILSVEEALNSMAGVDVQKSSGAGSRISIRGSGKSSGVLVLLNGRPLNSSQYGGVELSTIPIEIIQSITVFKPPVPVWLGPGSSEGAISIMTRATTQRPEDEKENPGKVRLAAGSYGLIESSISQRMNTDWGLFMGTADLSHKDGKRTNSDRDTGSVTLHWDREFAAQHQLELDARYYGSDYGSVGPVDNPTPDARQRYQKGSIDSRFSGALNDLNEYSINLYSDVIKLKDESQSGMISTLDNLKVGLKGENNWTDEDDNWAVRISTIVEREEVDHTLSGRHNRTTAGLGAQTDRNWKSVVLSLGLRGDHTTDFDLNPGFSSGLSIEIWKNWQIMANAGYSVNIPTFGQLYQPSHGSIDQARGNPDLDKERVWSYDTALKYQRDNRHMFQLSLFRSDTSDPIVYQRGSDLIYRPLNVDSSWRHGLEMTTKYTTEVGITLDASAIIQDSEITDSGKELPYTPHVKLKLSLLHTLEQTATRLETTVRYRSQQYSEIDNVENEEIDPYITVAIKATQPFTFASIPVEWFLSVENLFDADYDIHYGYPDDGIRFYTGLNMTF